MWVGLAALLTHVPTPSYYITTRLTEQEPLRQTISLTWNLSKHDSSDFTSPIPTTHLYKHTQQSVDGDDCSLIQQRGHTPHSSRRQDRLHLSLCRRLRPCLHLSLCHQSLSLSVTATLSVDVILSVSIINTVHCPSLSLALSVSYLFDATSKDPAMLFCPVLTSYVQ